MKKKGIFDQKKYDINYKKQNYKQLTIRVKKKEYEEIQKAIEESDMSKKDYILSAIQEKIKKESSE